jgi:hypothetical protein
MINLRAYNPEEILKLQLEEKPPLYLKLFQKDNKVTLNIVDKDGYSNYCGCILSVLNNGKLFLHELISNDYKLQLNNKGQIIIDNNNS